MQRDFTLLKHRIFRKIRRFKRWLNPCYVWSAADDECATCGCMDTAYAAPHNEILCQNCGAFLGHWGEEEEEDD